MFRTDVASTAKAMFEPRTLLIDLCSKICLIIRLIGLPERNLFIELGVGTIEAISFIHSEPSRGKEKWEKRPLGSKLYVRFIIVVWVDSTCNPPDLIRHEMGC